MSEHVIIDGNNLLYAMHVHGPPREVGRETLVKIVEQWAGLGDARVTLVFDGAVPARGLARQMDSRRIHVRFSASAAEAQRLRPRTLRAKPRAKSLGAVNRRPSAPVTADDVIVGMIHRAKQPGTLRIVTSDNAILHEARMRRCKHTQVAAFVRELNPPPERPGAPKAASPEKPESISTDETQGWLSEFGLDEQEPFDGYDAMTNP